MDRQLATAGQRERIHIGPAQAESTRSVTGQCQREIANGVCQGNVLVGTARCHINNDVIGQRNLADIGVQIQQGVHGDIASQ